MYLFICSSSLTLGNGGTSSRYVQGCLIRIQFSSVEHFQKFCCFGSHSGVNVGFGTLDVIMQIIAKKMNQVNCVISNFAIGMSWK